MNHNIKPGVATGDQVQEIFKLAKQKKFALPAVNVIGSSSINGVLETAKKLNAPVIIQFSNGGASFNAGKGLNNENQKAAISGSIAGAHHVHEMAKAYGVPVILHTDHCAKKLLPWIDGIMEANEKYFEEKGHSLFSSHMIDLSEEPIEENIGICKEYLNKRNLSDETIKLTRTLFIIANFNNKIKKITIFKNNSVKEAIKDKKHFKNIKVRDVSYCKKKLSELLKQKIL